MAITKAIDTPSKREERTDEAVIIAPLGKGYQVRVLRVTRDYFADAPPVEVSRRWLQRTMAQLMADADALPMLVSLPGVFDRWANEDDAAAAAVIAAAAAAAAQALVDAAAAAAAAAAQAQAEADAAAAAVAAQAAAQAVIDAAAAAAAAAAQAVAQAAADAAAAAAAAAAP